MGRASYTQSHLGMSVPTTLAVLVLAVLVLYLVVIVLDVLLLIINKVVYLLVVLAKLQFLFSLT